MIALPLAGGGDLRRWPAPAYVARAWPAGAAASRSHPSPADPSRRAVPRRRPTWTEWFQLRRHRRDPQRRRAGLRINDYVLVIQAVMEGEGDRARLAAPDRAAGGERPALVKRDQPRDDDGRRFLCGLAQGPRALRQRRGGYATGWWRRPEASRPCLVAGQPHHVSPAPRS